MVYTALVEETKTGYAAHIPNLPGCVATAETWEEMERVMPEAVFYHLNGIEAEYYGPSMRAFQHRPVVHLELTS